MGFNAEKIIPPGANIKVVGVGGGGGNAVNTMIQSNLEGVEFFAANTDVQALRFALPEKKIQIGKELTKGLGAGADPDVGRDAALEDRHEIQEALGDADMVFITAGMGGGTGTGGASVIAQIARELGALTVAVVTKPFNFEGKRRRKHAEMGIQRLRECVDTLITIPNQRLLQIATPDLSMVDAFRMADEVLVNAVKGISDIINIPGTINVDFADVKTVMSSMGMALMGIGKAVGENRSVDAARQAICSPLLEDIDIEGATGILINITASSNLTLMEVNEACSIIQDAAHEDANIIFGAVIDENYGDEIRVTVIATGFPAEFDDQPEADSQIFAPKRQAQKSNAFSARYDTQTRIVAPTPKQTLAYGKKETDPVSRTSFQTLSTPKANTPIAFETPNTSSMSMDEGSSHEAEDLTRMTLQSATDDLSMSDELDDLDHPIPVMNHEDLNAPLGAKMEELSTQLDDAPHSQGESEVEAASYEHSSLQDELESDDYLEGSLASSQPAPMDSLFEKADVKPSETVFDRKIDEAIRLAEKLKGHEEVQEDEKDLDIPAFLRQNPGDISLD